MNPVNRQRSTALSRIEEEAQRLLLQRKTALTRSPGAAPSRLPERRDEMAAIEEALGRIAEGRYGTCMDCGGPLGLQRIRAIPEARYCLTCSGSR